MERRRSRAKKKNEKKSYSNIVWQLCWSVETIWLSVYRCRSAMFLSHSRCLLWSTRETTSLCSQRNEIPFDNFVGTSHAVTKFPTIAENVKRIYIYFSTKFCVWLKMDGNRFMAFGSRKIWISKCHNQNVPEIKPQAKQMRPDFLTQTKKQK